MSACDRRERACVTRRRVKRPLLRETLCVRRFEPPSREAIGAALTHRLLAPTEVDWLKPRGRRRHLLPAAKSLHALEGEFGIRSLARAQIDVEFIDSDCSKPDRVSGIVRNRLVYLHGVEFLIDPRKVGNKSLS
jgi:hypothetical protein